MYPSNKNISVAEAATKSSSTIPDYFNNYLNLSWAHYARFYALLKIYYSGIPFRPTVLNINTASDIFKYMVLIFFSSSE